MRLSHLLAALVLAGGPVSAQVSAFPREVTYDFAFEINAMPPLGQSNAAIGFGVYSFETWGNWGAYGTYVSTPPEDLGTDLVSDGLAAIFDLEDDPTDDYDEGQLLTIKPFNYDREYTDQTVLSLGLTYKIADGIYGYGGGVARLRVFEKPVVPTAISGRRTARMWSTPTSTLAF